MNNTLRRKCCRYVHLAAASQFLVLVGTIQFSLVVDDNVHLHKQCSSRQRCISVNVPFAKLINIDDRINHGMHGANHHWHISICTSPKGEMEESGPSGYATIKLHQSKLVELTQLSTAWQTDNTMPRRTAGSMPCTVLSRYRVIASEKCSSLMSFTLTEAF